jgi:hypothetical protein
MTRSRTLPLGAIAALALVFGSAPSAGAMMTPAQKQLKHDQMALARNAHIIVVDEAKFPQLDARETTKMERHAATAANDELKATVLGEKITKLQEAANPNLEKIQHLQIVRADLQKSAAKFEELVLEEEAAHAQNVAARNGAVAKLHAAKAEFEAAIAQDEKAIEEGL